MTRLDSLLSSSLTLKSTHGHQSPATRHFIDAQWVAQPDQSNQPGSLVTLNPATEKPLASLARGGPELIGQAVAAARRAFTRGSWATMTPVDRAGLLEKLAHHIEDDAHTIATLETLENGMPLQLARNFGVGGAIKTLRYYAGWATKLSGETHTPSVSGQWHVFSTREPVGVVGMIVPWNMPFAMTVGKIAPALAAGCTVVIKPSELTSLSALRLAELIEECGFPPGVVNVVTGTGDEAGAALADHAEVDKISFTGSVPTGQRIVRAAASNLKRLILELGGKSPVFVFADCDIERTIQAVAVGIFNNAGQVCTAGSRLYLERSVYQQVVDGVVEAAEKLRLGSGMDDDTDMGPLISAEHRQRVMDMVSRSIEQGACLATGGSLIESAEGTGYFMQPTVLTDVHADMPVVDDEVFGPVLAVQVFDDVDRPEQTRDEQIIALANSTPYGLSASIWTADVARALRLARGIRSGTVKINSPFGVDPAVPFGGFGISGWGRGNGAVGIESYTEIKSTFLGL